MAHDPAHPAADQPNPSASRRPITGSWPKTDPAEIGERCVRPQWVMKGAQRVRVEVLMRVAGVEVEATCRKAEVVETDPRKVAPLVWTLADSEAAEQRALDAI
jgi:hypothetical protein